MLSLTARWGHEISGPGVGVQRERARSGAQRERARRGLCVGVLKEVARSGVPEEARADNF